MGIAHPAIDPEERVRSSKPSFESHAPIRVSAGLLVSFVIALGILAVGCAGAPPTPVAPGASEPLADDEGFLVIHIDTAVTVEKVRAGPIEVARDLPAGEYVWIIRAKADHYRWDGIRLAAQLQGSSTIRPEPGGVLNEKEFDFSLEAGQVNYPGHLLIELVSPSAGIGSGVSIRNRNHSAMAIRKLAKTHSKLLAAHPIRYAGSSGDGFLEFYTQERDRLGAKATGVERVK
jgi:hypothetical protein